MQYRTLGRTGIKVSPFALGAMMFGPVGNPDHDDAVAIVHRALDAGVNFLDTADFYSHGESEEIVAKAIAGRRDDVVLATKFHLPMGQDPNMRGNSRRWIVRAVEDSLRRLGTDHVDLYQVHRPDPDTDVEETLSALTDLVRAGKVRAIGTSSFPASEIVEAQWVSDAVGWNASAPSSRRTRCSTAASRTRCCRSPSGTAWAPSCTRRSRAGCSPGASAGARPRTSTGPRCSATSPTSAASRPSSSSWRSRTRSA